jgi:NAD(P)-dependent dehydrogenase (short-subunit alcohol dehydrogenase family)
MPARTALVVGGTSGIGAATVRRLSADGLQVVAAGLDAGPSEVHLDLREPSALEQLIGSLDRLDVLVNAAGIIRRGDEHQPEVFREVLEINLTGALRASEAAHDLLAAHRGCIVNVASMLSFFGGYRAAAYAASKGGIAQLTKALANEWAPLRINVNAIAPGYIKSRLNQHIWSDPQAHDTILQRLPAGRWGEPADLKGPVVFLASPASDYLHGVVLPVDGGYAGR